MTISEQITATLGELNTIVAKLSQQVTEDVTLSAGEQHDEVAAKELKSQIRKIEAELSKILPEVRSLARPANGSSTGEALKRRAERFGVVSDELKKLSDQEKLLKRKERFSGSSAVTSPVASITKSTDASSVDTSSMEEAKKKRLERFSLPAN